MGPLLDRILLALDDPGDADALHPLLRRLVTSAGVRVTVMQEVSFLTTMAGLPSELSPGPDGDTATAEGFVAAYVEFLRSEGICADGFVNVGRSGLMIAAAAERVEASLILLALRHPARLEALVRITPVPVLAVPGKWGSGPPRIGISVDDEESLDLIPYAADMARLLRAEISIVSVSRELLSRARDRTRRAGIPASVTLHRNDRDRASALLALPAALIVTLSAPEDVVRRLARESRIPLLFVRHPRPRAEPNPAVPLALPRALWSHRPSPNPLTGRSEP